VSLSFERISYNITILSLQCNFSNHKDKKKKKKLNIIIVKKEGGLIEKMVWTWKLHLEMGPKWQER